MNGRVTIRARAAADLQRAWQHYEREQPGLGDEFLRELRQIIHSLERHPERAAFYYRGFRRLLATQFPYKVFYRVVADRVIVFRVLHTKQDHPRRL